MIDLRTEVRKGTSAKFGGDAKAVGASLAAAIVGAVGSAIKRRVRERADLAGQSAPAWDTRFRGVLVAPGYPGASKGEQTRSGAWRFRDSETMHAELGTRRGSYSVSGGMWDGLSRIVITPTLCKLQFRGRSEGQQPSWRGPRKKGGARTAGTVRINNALKVSSVLRAHGVNVLALSEDELGSIGLGCVTSFALGMGQSFEVEWKGLPVSGSTVDEVLASALGVRAAPKIPNAAA